MSDGNFAEFITRERDRLNGERQNIIGQQRELQGKLAEIDREMEAITAYEAAKIGKAARGGNNSGRAQRQTRRGSKREDLMKVISEAGGLSRGEILEKMGLKGNKAGEMSVSNALTALTKNETVRRENGKYVAA
jgi:hypothetical protein